MSRKDDLTGDQLFVLCKEVLSETEGLNTAEVARRVNEGRPGLEVSRQSVSTLMTSREPLLSSGIRIERQNGRPMLVFLKKKEAGTGKGGNAAPSSATPPVVPKNGDSIGPSHPLANKIMTLQEQIGLPDDKRYSAEEIAGFNIHAATKKLGTLEVMLAAVEKRQQEVQDVMQKAIDKRENIIKELNKEKETMAESSEKSAEVAAEAARVPGLEKVIRDRDQKIAFLTNDVEGHKNRADTFAEKADKYDKLCEPWEDITPEKLKRLVQVSEGLAKEMPDLDAEKLKKLRGDSSELQELRKAWKKGTSEDFTAPKVKEMLKSRRRALDSRKYWKITAIAVNVLLCLGIGVVIWNAQRGRTIAGQEGKTAVAVEVQQSTTGPAISGEKPLEEKTFDDFAREMGIRVETEDNN